MKEKKQNKINPTKWWDWKMANWDQNHMLFGKISSSQIHSWQRQNGATRH